MEVAADFLYDLPRNYHYVFDLVHFILCVQGEKADLDKNELEDLPKKKPFSLWLSSIMVCFAGGLIVNPLVGESIFDAISDPIKLIMATAVWYIIFYVNPVDEFCKKFYAKLPLYLIKALYYPKKIVAGLKFAKKEFRGNRLATFLIPVLKANGSGFIKPFARFIRNSSQGRIGFEMESPSITTKYVAIATLIHMTTSPDLAYVLTTGLLIAMKVGPLFGFNLNKPFEIYDEKIAPRIFREINLVKEADKPQETKEVKQD